MVKRLAMALAIGLTGLISVTWAVQAAGAASLDTPVAVTPYSGFDASLTRAPYVTDLTQSSADVTWATSSQPYGTLKWGTSASGNCTTNAVPVPATLPASYPAAGTPSSITARQFTVNGVPEFQSTAAITGLTAGTPYCYRVFSGGTSPIDLLGTNTSPTFTTLDSVGASTSLTFDVVGDLGQTNYSNGTDFANSLNPDQAAIDSLIGSSGAKFVVTAGDIGYANGSQTNYGDLQQTGYQLSDVFGPSYWPETGGIPEFGVVGNHDQNVDGLRNWPASSTALASSGSYDYQSYPAVPADGVPTSTEPAAWYAISTGNVRIYVLDASWGDTNVGSSNVYQVDNDEHWTPSSPEYQWLAADLASHPGGVKLAVFHFPLRSDTSTETSDTNLQNSTANPNASTSLEALLSSGGVSIAFNGHAHTYQRINPRQAGQITNYVAGGGGGVLEPVDTGSICTSLLSAADVYALGWSPSGAGPTSGSGSSCGPGANTPQSPADVYNFLEVTVNGTTVTVAPTNAAGQVFDQRSYTPSSNSATPSTPANVTAISTSSSSVQINWNPSSESGGTITSYAVSRSSGGSFSPLTTLSAPSTGYTDTTVQPGAQYTYRVTATDNTSQTSAAGTSNKVATPTIPGGVTATATSPTSVQLDWTASTEAGGKIASYDIGRNGTQIATGVVGTAYTDTSSQPGTTYTYTVTAIDSIGAPSTPGTSNAASTPNAPVPLPLPPSISNPGPPVVNGNLPGPVTGIAALPDGSGYWLTDAQGEVSPHGNAVNYGSMAGHALNAPINHIVATPDGKGYWLVAADGGTFTFGDAGFFGSTGAMHLNAPVVDIAPTRDGLGYWLVASDGGIFAFGDAAFHGSMGGQHLNRTVVGISADYATGGYWEVATDGGIFSFGAPFFGSTGNLRLNRSVNGMTVTADGLGYWFVASDGGIFSFGDAGFHGSTGSITLNAPIVGMAADVATGSYWLVASDGGIFAFGAPFYGAD
jgi:hypothetical protein